MKKIMTACLLPVIFVFLTAFIPYKPLRIEGAWKIVEVQTIKKDGGISSTTPAESLVLFNKGYYSFCWTSQQGAPATWQQSDSLKLARLSQSIINTGAYTLTNDELVTKPLFAANPAFVNGSGVFSCAFHGDTLILTGTGLLSATNVPNPVYASGSHIVNKLLRIK